MLDVTESSFKEQVLESELPVLVDFWAEWCQPCKTMVPVLEAVAAKHEGRLRVVKVDLDANPDLGVEYRIRGLPTLMLFKDGKMAAMRTGAQGVSAVESMLE
jgi:thioredoxin 1